MSWEDTSPQSHATVHADFGAAGMVAEWDVPVVLEDGGSTGCNPLGITGSGGAIAIERGTCNFAHKALHAQNANFEYAVIYNTADREDVGSMLCVAGDEAVCSQVTIPVFFIDYAAGQALKAAVTSDPALRAHLACPDHTTTATTTTQTTVTPDPSAVISTVTAASLRGTIGTATDNNLIFGPFDAGFSANQICNGHGAMVGGMDTALAAAIAR